MSTADADRPVHLLDSRSLWGGIWVLVVALFFAAGLPILEDVLRQGELDAGEPYRIGDATIIPADGWSLSENGGELFTTFEKGGTTLTLITPAPSETTPSEAIDNTVLAFENDTTATWAVGDPTAFTTDAGAPGVFVVAHSPTDVSGSWVVEIADGISMTSAVLAPDSVWGTVADDIDAMVRSIAYDPEDAG